MPPPPLPRIDSTLRKPWLVETLVFFLVLWQEDLRLSLRNRGRVLPVPDQLQAFYYYHWGDFANGFVNAFLVDGVADVIIAGLRWRGKEGTASPRWRVPDPHLRAIIAAVLSSVSIVLFELRTTALNHADLLDLPAGIAGALVYLALRLSLLRFRLREG